VLALDPARIDQVPARLGAVKAFAALPEAEALAAANKRIGNILKQSRRHGRSEVCTEPVAGGRRAGAGLQPEAGAGHRSAERADRGDYTGALLALAKLKAAVDDLLRRRDGECRGPALRANRLALLLRDADDHVADMNRVADLSMLSSWPWRNT
jgi:glycyl-tRNA synthetase beta chain